MSKKKKQTTYKYRIKKCHTWKRIIITWGTRK